MADIGVISFLNVSTLLLSFTPTEDLLLTPACSASVEAINAGPCAQVFEISMRRFISDDGGVLGSVACNGIATLRDCILVELEKSCGSDASNLVTFALKGIVGAFKASSGEDLTCNGNEVYCPAESLLCWPSWIWGFVGAVAVGAVLVFVLLLLISLLCSSCYIYCLKYCYKSAKNRAMVCNLLPTENPLTRTPAYYMFDFDCSITKDLHSNCKT